MTKKKIIKKVVSKKKAGKNLNKPIKIMFGLSLLFFFIAIMLLGVYTYNHVGLMRDLELMYANNGTEYMCSQTGLMVKDRCLLTTNIDYTASDVWYESRVDCTWGMYSTRSDTNYKPGLLERVKLKHYNCEWIETVRI